MLPAHSQGKKRVNRRRGRVHEPAREGGRECRDRESDGRYFQIVRGVWGGVIILKVIAAQLKSSFL